MITKYESAMLPLLPLSWHKELILTSSIVNGCLSEAGRDGDDGLITQTD